MSKKIVMVLCCVATLLWLSACGSGDEEAAAATSTPMHDHAAEHTAAPSTVAAADPGAQTASAPADASGNQTTSAAADANTVTLTIDMHDSYYGDSDTNMTDPPLWTVPKGTTLLVNLINHGKENHNWAIVKAGAQVPNPFVAGRNSDILLLEPGMVYSHSQTQWVIYAPEPGEYDVICTVEGHYPLMRGKLVVTE